MAFVDEIVIELTAGRGGRGCASFHRARHVPLGGPNGGDGGDGGSFFVVADKQCATLGHLRRRRRYQADSGKSGQSTQKNGRNGASSTLTVPVGTKIYDNASNTLVADLVKDQQRFCVAKGGQGGLGNIHFKSSTNRAPRQFTEGEEGECRLIRLELQVLADVGLLGFPNAGKSTLLRTLSSARPKVADYPFTTLQPHLGVVDVGWDGGFVVADIPGLIEGASQGIGLGLQFLRHVSRCQYLLHMIAVSDVETEVKQWKSMNHELACYHASLVEKPQILVLSKTDLLTEDVQSHVLAFKESSGFDGEVLTLSSFTKDGVDVLVKYLAKQLAVV